MQETYDTCTHMFSGDRQSRDVEIALQDLRDRLSRANLHLSGGQHNTSTASDPVASTSNMQQDPSTSHMRSVDAKTSATPKADLASIEADEAKLHRHVN